MQAIIVGPPDLLPDPPGNVLVVPSVPMLALLPRLDAVISHGGMNTVCETLAHGVPLVLAPIRHDQPVVASQVVTGRGRHPGAVQPGPSQPAAGGPGHDPR